MDVDMAKAQLDLAEAEADLAETKAAFHNDPDDKKLRAAFVKSKGRVVEARDEWRNNWRTAPNGPGDATADPDPVTASGEAT